jgi:hypothetical protein
LAFLSLLVTRVAGSVFDVFAVDFVATLGVIFLSATSSPPPGDPAPPMRGGFTRNARGAYCDAEHEIDVSAVTYPGVTSVTVPM